MAKVVLENVYKTFPDRIRSNKIRWTPGSKLPEPVADDRATVLRHINLTVTDGEFLVLVGPSGCGKSTLLRLIAGLETVTAGNIWVGDRRVNDLAPKVRDVAMVFQSYALYPHLKVYDNLAFGLRRVGGSAFRQEKQIRAHIQHVAEMLQIEALFDRFPRQLSGGQKQRVALGRAIARNPQVFLMDEPLSNLDARLRTETRVQIVNLQRQLGITTLYVTHDQVEAMTMGQQIAVMSNGLIQQVASPLDLYDRPANQFVAGFIGSPPMNFLPVQIRAAATVVHPLFCFELPKSWVPYLGLHCDRTVWLGIRPEHLQLSDARMEHLPGIVEQVEALGSETYLTIRIAGISDRANRHPSSGLSAQTVQKLQVRIQPEERVELGDSVQLALRLDKVHLFEQETGRSLLTLS